VSLRDVSPHDLSPHDLSPHDLSPHEAARAARAARGWGQPAFISVLSDEEISTYPATGQLAGIPFAIKDNIDLAGHPTTAANPSVTQPAKLSAAVVQHLIEAGAVPMGKTNLDQYATGLVGTRSPFGACHSVFSDEHISGGSSSGSAIAVASGIVPFALGTDTAGSGRVPAAFNALVGIKPTRGLVSTTGVLPACRTLDCVTVLATSVALAAAVFDAMVAFDPADPYSRPAPVGELPAPVGVMPSTRHRPLIGIPDLDLDLDPLHQQAWEQAIAHATTRATVIPVDVRPFLAAAELLYAGPWLAERALSFRHLLTDGVHIDPTVRAIVSQADRLTAMDTFAGMYRLAELRRQSEPTWDLVDALLLPVTPTHPRLAEVAADPIGVDSRLGRFTNMTNLLDLCAVAVPAGMRNDGLPFGVQLLAPAFSDQKLVDLAAHWCGEAPLPSVPTALDGTVLLAVAGAHLSGQPLNHDLLRLGGRLAYTARTDASYRMFEIPGPLRRPGLTRDRIAHTEKRGGIEVEVWRLPVSGMVRLLTSVSPPLAIGPMDLADGTRVLGFVAASNEASAGREITSFGGWRAYLAATDSMPQAR
jgi:allophanate hydrolase